MNVRHIIQESMLAATAALTLVSCGLMTEDQSDCPTGLYVNFVYDYNIQRADMFKEHVGGLTLYVYDESDRLVAQRTVSGSELKEYGYFIHFSEDELAPDHQYRISAVALQKNWDDALQTSGAKYRKTDLKTGDDKRQALTVKLDHSQGKPYGEVSAEAPLDTLWHTFGTLITDSPTRPAATNYNQNRDGAKPQNNVETVSVIKGIPTYATVSLIRDTNHLNLSLFEITQNIETGIYEEIGGAIAEDYQVFIIDDNTDVDYENNVIAPADSVIYRPYAQWTTTIDEDIAVQLNQQPSSAHYDLMFNRLRYNSEGKNARLVVLKKETGENVATFNLPRTLSMVSTSYEYRYKPQEYLDREFDFRLELFLQNGKWVYANLYIATLPYVIRPQDVILD